MEQDVYAVDIRDFCFIFYERRAVKSQSRKLWIQHFHLQITIFHKFEIKFHSCISCRCLIEYISFSLFAFITDIPELISNFSTKFIELKNIKNKSPKCYVQNLLRCFSSFCIIFFYICKRVYGSLFPGICNIFFIK